jgi:hypothetical protein
MATFTVAHGPLEREATHTVNGGLILNALDAWPRFEIVGQIGNYRGRPPVDDTADDNPGRIGATPRAGLWRPKDINYAVNVIGRDLAELRDGETLIGSAFADPRALSIMAVAPAGDHDGQEWAFAYKTIACGPGAETFDAHARPGPFQTLYTVALRMFDPRFYAGADGGLDHETVSLSDGTPGDAQNQGTAPADPIFQIPGPLSDADVTLTNVTTGKVVVLAHVDVDSGDTLTVDFGTRRLTLDDGTIVRRFLDKPASTWWKSGIDGLPPLTTSSLKIDGADATVLWDHASWG